MCFLKFVFYVTGKLPHKHKIVIAGNHELSFDKTFTHPLRRGLGHHSTHMGPNRVDEIPTLGIPKDIITEAVQTHNVKDCLTNCIYLEDSEVILYGLKIYGTPW